MCHFIYAIMKNLYILLLSVFCFSAHAQLTTQPSFDNITGVTKTVMNPKLYPLLLKVHISENNIKSSDFKNFISNLKHFEVFSSDGNLQAETALNSQTLIYTSSFSKVKEQIFEHVTDEQKEYIILKKNNNGLTSTVYAFTTKLEYNRINELSFL